MKSQTYPKNWDIEPLKNSINLINGRAYALHEWESSGIPVIRLQNLTGSSENYYYSNLNLPEKNYCYSGDLLYMWSATFGPYIWSGEKAIFHYHIWKLGISSRNDKDYIYHLLNNISENLKKTASNGGTMLHITKGFMDELLLPLPPFDEQQKIAQALTDADNYISALEKLIEKKKMIKEGLMANLLTGKQRLKEFAFNEDGTAKGYKDSELGKIPEDWDLYNLDEIADVIDPHPSHRAPPIDRDGIPFLGIGDFSTDGKIINNNPRLVNISVFKEHRERYQLEDNLIGLGRVASIGKVIRLNANEKYSISPTLGIIRGTSVSNDLIFYLLSSRFVSLQFNRILSGSTRSSVGMNVLREVKIALPQSPKEQLSLGKLLIDIDQDIQKLESKYQKSHDLKQGMMQKLLTGEIRLV